MTKILHTGTHLLAITKIIASCSTKHNHADIKQLTRCVV